MNREKRNEEATRNNRGLYRGARGDRGARGGFRGARGARGPKIARGDREAKDRRSNNNNLNKKFADKSHISSLLKQQKSFALQRLMRDYNEIKKSNNDLYGVSALPLESNFFNWHGNVKALRNNIYNDYIMHIQIEFTEKYPIEPPTIRILNHHYSFEFGEYISLDILNPKSPNKKAWNPSYTVLSILIELQDFFSKFDNNYQMIPHKEKEIKKNIEEKNQYKCSMCLHNKNLNYWPEISQSLYKKSWENYQEEKEKEFVCYYSKLDFQENPLGLGITISKIPRTQEIKGIIPKMDYIALKCFTKQKLRKDRKGDKFTHWFPLYFGNKDEQFFHLAKKAISLISSGSTRNFKPDMIFTVLPKFIMSLIVEIGSENVVDYSRSLKVLSHIYRIIIFFEDKFPEIYKKFENTVSNFIENPQQRHKDNTPSLGELIIYTIISKNYSFEDILPAYLSEQLDRQIFWILQSIPELEKLIESSSIDDIRAKICFKSFLTGSHILLFSYYFSKSIIFKGIKKNEEIAKLMDSNNGIISEESINIHEKEIKKIFKIDNFQDYYKYLNLPVLNDQQVNEKLKQAYKNSAEKKYHGFDAVRFVPNPIKQIEKYLEKFPKLEDLMEGEKLKNENDPIWKDLVLEKFELARLIKCQFPAMEMTPILILENYERIRRQNLFTKKKHSFEDYKQQSLDKMEEFELKFKNENEKILMNFTWRKIYIKFYLEMLIKHFNNFADFKYLYKFLDITSSEIIHFNLDVGSTSNLKSDYNYIRVLLGKITNLKLLNLNVLSSGSTKYPTNEGKLTKNLIKGINNFKNLGGNLQSLKLFIDHQSYFSKEDMKTLSIWNILDKLPDLKSLDCSDSNLNEFAVEKIRNHFYYSKSITTLILTNCNLNDNTIKNLSDGLMKAKGIENIFINNNKEIRNLSGIVNNLAFQPSLKILDIGENTNLNDIKNLCEEITKMLKMSQSLDTLICSDIPNFNKNFNFEFFTSLGDNASLRYLDLSNSGPIDFRNMGTAIAMNSLKKGNLEVLRIRGNNNFNFTNFETFIKSLIISEEIHNKWYGNNFNIDIAKNTKEYYETKFHNNLKFLDFGGYNLNTSININDLKNKSENEIKNLLINSKNLKKISFKNGNCNKYFIEMLNNALQYPNNLKYLNMEKFLSGELLVKLFTNSFYTKNENGDLVKNENNQLEKLDLSNNKFGYSGIESLSKVLMENKSLKYLNLYHNLFNVNGARRLSESLLNNKTLEVLDIGYNRIRDLGFKNIAESLINNKESKISQISFRCNFIRSEIIMKILPELNKENNRITVCNLSNNLINEESANKIYENLYQKENRSKINSDIFSINYLNNPERLERCVWITTVNEYASKVSILEAFDSWEAKLIEQENSHMGVILDLKLFKGRRVISPSTKGVVEGNRLFVEFVDPNSVNRLLKIASTEGFFISNSRLKVFRAGTRKEVVLPKKKFNK